MNGQINEGQLTSNVSPLLDGHRDLLVSFWTYVEQDGAVTRDGVTLLQQEIPGKTVTLP